MITRRALFGFLAAPAIVPVASLMPVRRMPLVMATDLAVVLTWKNAPVFDWSTGEQWASFNRAAYKDLMSQTARYNFARAE